MELKEAREMAVDLITVKDTPVYIRPMCEAFMLLDDRVTELETQQNELFKACEKAIKYLSPTARLDSGLVRMLVKLKQ